jgi:hypothetical protein
VSFDLYFLDRAEGQTYQDAMDALEEAVDAEVSLSESDLIMWSRIEARLTPLLPGSQIFVGEHNRELTHEPSGLQVSLYGGELVVHVPYWYSGDEAERAVELLRSVAEVVEEETGLIAYDPQAEAAFLGEGDAQAAASFDRVQDRFAGENAIFGKGEVPSAPPKRRGWRGVLGR